VFAKRTSHFAKPSFSKKSTQRVRSSAAQLKAADHSMKDLPLSLTGVTRIVET